jgi:hypothetical protein
MGYLIYQYSKGKKKWHRLTASGTLDTGGPWPRDQLFDKKKRYLYLPIGEVVPHIDLGEGDLLIRDDYNQERAVIVDSRKVPKGASIWYKAEDSDDPEKDFRRVWGNTAGTRPAPLQTVADSMGPGDLFLVLGDDYGLLANVAEMKAGRVDTDTLNGKLQLDDTPDALADFDEDMFRVTATFIAVNRKKLKDALKDAEKALNKEDQDGYIAASVKVAAICMNRPVPSSYTVAGATQQGYQELRRPQLGGHRAPSTGDKLKAAGKGFVGGAGDVVTGATPGLVQGHNVLLSFSAQWANLNHFVQYCHTQAKPADFGDFESSGGDAESGINSVDLGWQAIGSVVSTIITVVKLGKIATEWKLKGNTDVSYRHLAHKEQRAKLKMLAPELATNLAKSFTTITSAVDTISKLAGGAGTALGTGANAANMTSVTPFVSAVTGFVSMGICSRASHRAGVRMAKLKRLRKAAEDLKGRGTITLSPNTQALLGYAIKKMKRKERFKGAEAGVGGLSVATGIIGGVLAITVFANAWNPVGWGLGVAVLVAGAGLLTYKIVRKKGFFGHGGSKARAKARAKKYGADFGDEKLNSKHYASLLISEYLKERPRTKGAKKNLNCCTLEGIMMAFGIDAWKLVYSPDYTMAAMKRISRKL